MHEFVTAINGTGTTLILMLLAIFLGIWLNRRDVDQLRTDLSARIDNGFAKVDARFNAVDARFNAMAARIDRIHEDFGHFHHTQGQHDARLDALEEK